MACVGGGSQITSMSNITFINDDSTSLNYDTLNIYSDGSCEGEFWYSQSVCPGFKCSSCTVSN